MALYQQYTFSTYHQMVMDLSAFLAANGWTIDLDAAYQTTNRRLHCHKGEAHFDMYSNATSNIKLYACTGYSSGSAPNLQPGVSGLKTIINGAVGNPYWFISVEGAVYIATYGVSLMNWAVMFNAVPIKIGAWANGFGAIGSSNVGMFSISTWSSANGNAQIYFNGAWSAYQNQANGLAGGNYTSDLGSRAGFSLYNGGLIPQPILLFICNTTDITKKHPIGYAPGIYKANGRDVYDIAEELIIGSDTYIIMPQYNLSFGNITNGDFLFKLGA